MARSEAAVGKPSERWHRHAMLFTLGAPRIEEGHYETSKRWRAGAKTWESARRLRVPMAIVFTDGINDSNNVFRHARITRFDVSDGGTEIAWTDVGAIEGYEVDSLVKVSDGEPVELDGRRYFSVVKTPAFLRAPRGGRASSPTNTSGRRQRATHSAATLEDADHDPLAYEQVWRRLRRHQSAFRTNLLLAYGRRCAISAADEPCVLEAAHIDPHSKSGDNRTDNGLLLRADLHVLFDMGLLRVAPGSLRIELHASLRGSSYGELHGQRLRPRTDGGRPDDDALQARWNAPVETAGDVP